MKGKKNILRTLSVMFLSLKQKKLGQVTAAVQFYMALTNFGIQFAQKESYCHSEFLNTA